MPHEFPKMPNLLTPLTLMTAGPPKGRNDEWKKKLLRSLYGGLSPQRLSRGHLGPLKNLGYHRRVSLLHHRRVAVKNSRCARGKQTPLLVRVSPWPGRRRRRARMGRLRVVRFAVRLLALHLVRRVVWVRPRCLLYELLASSTETLSKREPCCS